MSILWRQARFYFLNGFRGIFNLSFSWLEILYSCRAICDLKFLLEVSAVILLENIVLPPL
jgi:hypothetical protein